jgi:hypothetical protein
MNSFRKHIYKNNKPVQSGQANPTQPGKPSGEVTYADPGDSIAVSWLASNSESGTISNYIIKRSVQSGEFTNLATSSNTSFVDTNIIGGNQYRYKIIAVDNLGQQSEESEPSDQIVVDVKIIARPSGNTFGPESDTYVFSIYSNVTWAVSDNPDWITVSPTSATGNSTMTIQYQENDTADTREGVISITGSGVTETHTLTQTTLSVEPRSFTVSKFQTTRQLDIKTPNAWTVEKSVTWVSFSTSGGFENEIIDVNIAQNSKEERITTIVVTDTVTEQFINVQITQETAAQPTTAIIISDRGGSPIEACDFYNAGTNTRKTRYVPEGETFSNATNLFLNDTGTSVANAGYYSDGTITREWNGSGFEPNDGLCF